LEELETRYLIFVRLVIVLRYVRQYAMLDSTVKVSASRDIVKCNWATGKKCTLRERASYRSTPLTDIRMITAS